MNLNDEMKAALGGIGIGVLLYLAGLVAAWLTFILLTTGCMVVNYKSNVSHVKTSTGDALNVATTENLTEADTISPEIKGQIAEKMQGADQIKMGAQAK